MRKTSIAENLVKNLLKMNKKDFNFVYIDWSKRDKLIKCASFLNAFTVAVIRLLKALNLRSIHDLQSFRIGVI